MYKLRELERAGLDSDQARESHDPDPMHLFQTLSNRDVSFFFRNKSPAPNGMYSNSWEGMIRDGCCAKNLYRGTLRLAGERDVTVS